MFDIFCSALLGGFLGTLFGCAIIAGVIKSEIDEIRKKMKRDVILDYTIIEYEN